MMYFSILLSILLGVFFSYFVTCAQAGKGFCIVMAVLAVYSLAAFALRPLADRGILTPPVFANAYGGEFYNYILAFVPKTMFRDRNFAFSGSRAFTSSSCSWHCISASTTWHGKRNSICGAAAAFFAWHC